MLEERRVKKLFAAFPNSFINHNLEFIAHKKANEFFVLGNCNTVLDVKCKVLEWLSRGAFKTNPFYKSSENAAFHKFMLSGINTYLGTNFDEKEIAIIYQMLGNAVRRTLTIEFINSGYDMAVLINAARAQDEQIYFEL